MRRFSSLLLLLIALISAPAAVWAQGAFSNSGTPHITAKLEAETLRPAPGSVVTLAFVMTPEPGWHGYWLNPGDAGKPIEPRWSLPEGATTGPLRYPVPQTLLVAGLMNHVYEGRYAVLADLHVPPGLIPGTVMPIKVHLDWLACTDAICVPEQANLALSLTIGVAQPSPEHQARFDDYRRKLPRPLGGAALFAAQENGSLRLSIPYPAAAPLEAPHFFSADAGAKSYAGAQTFTRDGDRLIVAIEGLVLSDSDAVRGVLKIGPDTGLDIVAHKGAVPQPSDSGKGWRGVLLALIGAIAGGLILNIMPCVFPVLSLKAMSLLRGASSPQAARKEAWAYAAGVMSACMALGGAVMALRAGGASIGWAFQLQSPAVVLMLLALSLAIALELAGVWRMAALSIGGGLTTRRGLIGDFWSGVLVAFVATPCTGPFMAGALGAALVLPTGAALAIFAGLGLGIALPFLLLGHIPALRRALPRPGPWMERVQRWLSIPMALTVLGLLWLLWRQAGGAGLGIGVAVATVLTALLWWLGRAQARERHFAGLVTLLVAAAVLAGGGVALSSAQPSAQALATNSFNPAALERARASAKPVFLYFTADWCLSCKVNEAGAINRAEVRAAFEKAGVQVIVGDWTNGDPAITRFLESRRRSGVPLYLWYPPNGGEPKELPQILTPAMLVALAQGEG